MYCRQFVEQLHDQFGEHGMDLSVAFFMAFSRFEFALKQSGAFAQPRGRNGDAEADWDGFAASIAPHFVLPDPSALKEAVDYILGDPPKVQVLDAANNLSWQPRLVVGSNVQQLNIYIRRMRNNLFHGGKFQGKMIPDVSRNHRLLSSAIIVLDEWLQLSPQVLHCFQEPIPA
jgi:hypothetical protein